jgi:hypothetical protein
VRLAGKATRHVYQHLPNCAKPMILMRAIGRSGGLADLNIFECNPCHVSVTEAVIVPPQTA